jgi:hypothetical protein
MTVEEDISRKGAKTSSRNAKKYSVIPAQAGIQSIILLGN